MNSPDISNKEGVNPSQAPVASGDGVSAANSPQGLDLSRSEIGHGLSPDEIRIMAHHRIEELITKYTPLIENTTRRWGGKRPDMGASYFQSAVYDALVNQCFKGKLLLFASGVHELKLMIAIVNNSCVDEVKKFQRQNRAVAFSQIAPADGNQEFGDLQFSSTGYSAESAQSSIELQDIKSLFSALGVELTERQLRVLEVKLEAIMADRKAGFREIAAELGISEVTVKRDMMSIRETVRAQSDKGGSIAPEEEGVVADYSQTGQRRADYRAMLQDAVSLGISDRNIEFMKVYLGLSESGKRPAMGDLMTELGLTEGQVKRCFRVLNTLRPNSLGLKLIG